MSVFELAPKPTKPLSLYLHQNGKLTYGALFRWCARCEYCKDRIAAPGLLKCNRHLGERVRRDYKMEVGRGHVAWLCLERALTEPVQSKFDPALLDLKLRFFETLQDPTTLRRRPKQHTLDRIAARCPTVVQDTFESDTLTGLTRARLCAYIILRVEAGLLYGQTGRPRTREKTQTDGRFDVIAIAEQAAASSARAERADRRRRTNDPSDDLART